jgi:hypothetical protein
MYVHVSVYVCVYVKCFFVCSRNGGCLTRVLNVCVCMYVCMYVSVCMPNASSFAAGMVDV